MDINQVIAEYQSAYEAQFGPEAGAYLKRRTMSSLEAVTAEAVVFRWACSLGLGVSFADDPSRGGMDFRCDASGNGHFYFEVTMLGEDAAQTRSGIPKEMHDGQSGWFAPVTPSLHSKVEKKAKSKQLATADAPVLLVIPTLHVAGPLLYNGVELEALLTPDIHVVFPVGGSSEDMVHETDFAKAAFVRFDPTSRTITARNQSVSGVLLIAISGNGVSVGGALHPEPYRPFDPELLPGVPFVRYDSWPFKGDSFGIEWTGGQKAAFFVL